MIIIEPDVTPVDPSLSEIARPTMSTMDGGATPHTSEPISKILIDIRKTHMVE